MPIVNQEYAAPGRPNQGSHLVGHVLSERLNGKNARIEHALKSGKHRFALEPGAQRVSEASHGLQVVVREVAAGRARKAKHTEHVTRAWPSHGCDDLLMLFRAGDAVRGALLTVNDRVRDRFVAEGTFRGEIVGVVVRGV